ncbi:MAG: magnesium transporter, partial [Clostridia bacterium]|nr:magnesium transporter [Clostridia bacterium]
MDFDDIEKVAELLEKKSYGELRIFLNEANEVDVALLLSDLENEDMLRAFRLLDKDVAADVFAELEPDDQERLIGYLTDAELGAVLSEMYDDDAADLIGEMPAS